MYELEIYPVVLHCQGLNQGVYHYDPLNHQLEQIVESEDDILALLGYGLVKIVVHPRPQVLLVITARFGRLFRRYRSIAYALILKHIGVLQQNFYLVATNMGLAPSAWGVGDSDAFGRVAGLDYLEESAVGEFALGSLPNRNVEASGLESIEVDDAEGLTQAMVWASEIEFGGVEAESESGETEVLGSQVESVGLVAKIPPAQVWESPENTSAQVEDTGAEAVDLAPSDMLSQTPDSSSVAEGESESAGISASEVETSALQISLALHPHDLDDRIPGLAQLHNQTLGDPRITIVIIDGDPDYTLSCFAEPSLQGFSLLARTSGIQSAQNIMPAFKQSGIRGRRVKRNKPRSTLPYQKTSRRGLKSTTMLATSPVQSSVKSIALFSAWLPNAG